MTADFRTKELEYIAAGFESQKPLGWERSAAVIRQAIAAYESERSARERAERALTSRLATIQSWRLSQGLTPGQDAALAALAGHDSDLREAYSLELARASEGSPSSPAGLTTDEKDMVARVADKWGFSKPDASPAPERDMLTLRRLVWLRHPCVINGTSAYLYGDDGEMQCSQCRFDFLRASVADVDTHVLMLNVRLNGLAPAPSSPAATPVERFSCRCDYDDSWRCAKAKNLTTVTCHCACHSPVATEPET